MISAFRVTCSSSGKTAWHGNAVRPLQQRIT